MNDSVKVRVVVVVDVGGDAVKEGGVLGIGFCVRAEESACWGPEEGVQGGVGFLYGGVRGA